MILDAWLQQAGMTEQALATKVGVTQSAIHKYRRGQRRPNYERAQQISAVTGGAVTIADLMSRPKASS